MVRAFRGLINSLRAARKVQDAVWIPLLVQLISYKTIQGKS